MALFNNARNKTINGKEVFIFLLPASKGIVMAKKLSQILLPTMASFAELGGEDGITLSDVAMTLVDSMDSLDIQEIISQLLAGMSIDGQEVNFDNYFMGNYGELLEVMTFALEQNFKSFFTGSDFVKQLKDKLPQMPQPVMESKPE